MKLFWWRQSEDFRNLGDEIGAYILENRFGVPVERSSRFHAEAIGTGSILNWVFQNREKRATEAPLHVIGSGLMFPQIDLNEIPYLRLHGVRGYLTRSCVSKTDDLSIGVGDPGVLVSDLFPAARGSSQHQLGIIAHVGFQQDAHTLRRIEEARSNGLNVRVLDIATEDFGGFFDQMKMCDYILSQSLHGLIFADSFGIPNVWWDDKLLNSQGGRFKFYDYFSSIDRPFGLRLSSERPLDSLSLEALAYCPPAGRMESLRRGVREYHHKAVAAFNSLND